ncbi:SGNH/GDSL hydrolase family protein, partial [bacterium]|nr:SGNH/GDSL hydrolase family protein [bacterium]
SGLPGVWSDSRQFHKSTLPSLTISDGADGRFSPTTDMPKLAWEESDGTAEYDLEFSSDIDFTSVFGRIRLMYPELDFSEVDRTTWDCLEGIFYWRVAGVASEGVPGPWSDPCRLSKTLIDSPIIIGPDDGAVFAPTSTQPILIWNSLGTQGKYEFRLYADSEGKTDWYTWLHYGSTTCNFKTDLDINDETWFYAPFTLYWSIAGVDSEDRPGPFSSPREMIKPGYHRFAGYGDSITAGECVENGYFDILDNMLTSVWGKKTSWANIAVPGMKSSWGEDNIASRLKGSCPQFVLIMFGTNDSVDAGNCNPQFECDVAGHLAEMATIARNRGTIPIIATIIPVNPDGRQAIAQGDVDDNNLTIIAMCAQMNIQLVDLNAMFWAHGNIPELFCDWGHPNEAGYQIMASGYFDGIMSAVN